MRKRRLPCEGREVVLLDGFLGSDDDGSCAVANAAGAAGRDHASLLEDGGQLGEALQRRLHGIRLGRPGGSDEANTHLRLGVLVSVHLHRGPLHLHLNRGYFVLRKVEMGVDKINE